MSEVNLTIVDERPVVKVVDERPIVRIASPGPQGPAGNDVIVSETAPDNPKVGTVWVKPL